MKKSILLLFVLMFFVPTVFAQTVYVFRYDYTEQDGVKSRKIKDGNAGFIYFIAIANGRMGTSNTNKNTNALDNWDKFCENAISKINDEYDYFGKNIGYNGRFRQPSPYGDFYSYYLLCDEYSTSTKTTYRSISNKTIPNGAFNKKWEGEKWDNSCYTIKSDHSELIIWNLQNPGRDYYKRVTRSDLRPNTDFLYD